MMWYRRSLQDGSRSRLRCLPRRHRRFHHHKRGFRPHGPDPRSQGKGRETDDLSFSFHSTAIKQKLKDLHKDKASGCKEGQRKKMMDEERAFWDIIGRRAFN